MNRPEKRNALSHALRKDLIAALHAADEDPAVRVTIVRGGGPCFSAGYDLSEDITAGGWVAGKQERTRRGLHTAGFRSQLRHFISFPSRADLCISEDAQDAMGI